MNVEAQLLEEAPKDFRRTVRKTHGDGCQDRFGCAMRWTRNSRTPPEETAMSLLQINNLNVRFGDANAVPVVDGLDLNVDAERDPRHRRRVRLRQIGHHDGPDGADRRPRRITARCPHLRWHRHAQAQRPAAAGGGQGEGFEYIFGRGKGACVHPL